MVERQVLLARMRELTEEIETVVELSLAKLECSEALLSSYQTRLARAQAGNGFAGRRARHGPVPVGERLSGTGG